MGITLSSTPVYDPVPLRLPPLRPLPCLPPLQEVFKLLCFVDDLKVSITSMHEFILVDSASLLFENASGCKLHRDPNSGKVKFLP